MAVQMKPIKLPNQHRQRSSVTRFKGEEERLCAWDSILPKDTALRLSRYLGTTPDVWLNLQKAFELRVAELESGKDIEKRIKPSRLDQRLDEVNRFEAMLTDEGVLLIKFWFHLSRARQKAPVP